MRNISQSAVDKLSTLKGVEPINIIEVQWALGAASYFYSDRYINEEVPGKILSLANLENVVNVGKSGLSQTVSLTLDDIDGTIKTIYDTHDVHKRPVYIYQWFTGIPLSDKFLIFQGVINSPIVWKEGDRTLSFEIVSKLEDAEVGFSAEEGFFEQIPQELIGKAWPLPFGTCLKVPGLKIDLIPSGVVLDAGGVEDYTLVQQINKLQFQLAQVAEAASREFALAAVCYYNSHFAIKEWVSQSKGVPSEITGSGTSGLISDDGSETSGASTDPDSGIYKLETELGPIS